jgi:nucleoside-diphosphate-sugar epimerase
MGYMASFTGGVLRKPFLLNKDKAKEGVQKYWIFDTSRIRKELNFIPEILPKEGFPQTYRWYLEKGWLK